MHGSEIEALKADLRRMQARVDELETAGEEPTNRRNMLRGLGAAAVGATVGGLAFARPAAADAGANMQMQTSNTVTSNTALVAHSSNYNADESWGLLHLTDDATDANSQSVLSLLTVNATGNGAGFIVGAKIGGATTGLKLGGDVPLKLNDSGGGPSQSGGTIGQFKVNAGDLWFCVDDNSSHNWRKLAGLATAGAFHALTPYRAYDSRQAIHPTSAVGVLASGANRLIGIKDSINSNGSLNTSNVVPAGATAVTANITVTATGAPGGFLSANPGGNTSQTTSVINWFAAGQTFANGLTLTLNTSRQLTIVCGSGGGSAHFIIDISGYYL